MPLITPEQIEAYHRDGYFILQAVITENVLEALREECMRYVDIYEQEMEAKGLKTYGINHYKKRYFISNRSASSPIMTEFLFGDLMAEVCRATLGDNAYLFNVFHSASGHHGECVGSPARGVHALCRHLRTGDGSKGLADLWHQSLQETLFY